MALNNSVLIVGGDKRQDYVFKDLKKKGFECERENADVKSSIEKLTEFRCIVLPIPVSFDGKYIFV